MFDKPTLCFCTVRKVIKIVNTLDRCPNSTVLFTYCFNGRTKFCKTIRLPKFPRILRRKRAYPTSPNGLPFILLRAKSVATQSRPGSS